jgi:hypothetical protein
MTVLDISKTSMGKLRMDKSSRRLPPSAVGADARFIYNYRSIVRERLKKSVEEDSSLSHLIGRLSESGWSDLCRIYHTSRGATDIIAKELTRLSQGLPQDWLTDAMKLIVASLEPQQGQLTLTACQANGLHQVIMPQALNLFRLTWPRGYEEYQAAIEHVVYIEGDGFVSCSIPSHFGQIFLSANRSTTIASTLELLVHESAHHALSARQRFVRFSDGVERQIPSPLRQDLRNQEAVLHAAFVCARVSFVMYTVMCHGHKDRDFDEIRQRNLEALGSAVSTLRRTDGWTPLGDDLLKRLDRFWKRFSQMPFA